MTKTLLTILAATTMLTSVAKAEVSKADLHAAIESGNSHVCRVLPAFEGINQSSLSLQNECWLDVHRSDKVSGSDFGTVWAKLNGKYYSVPLKDIRTAGGKDAAKELFSSVVGAQVAADQAAISSTVAGALDAYNSIAATAGHEAAVKLVEVSTGINIDDLNDAFDSGKLAGIASVDITVDNAAAIEDARDAIVAAARDGYITDSAAQALISAVSGTQADVTANGPVNISLSNGSVISFNVNVSDDAADVYSYTLTRDGVPITLTVDSNSDVASVFTAGEAKEISNWQGSASAALNGEFSYDASTTAGEFIAFAHNAGRQAGIASVDITSDNAMIASVARQAGFDSRNTEVMGLETDLRVANTNLGIQRGLANDFLVHTTNVRTAAGLSVAASDAVVIERIRSLVAGGSAHAQDIIAIDNALDAAGLGFGDTVAEVQTLIAQYNAAVAASVTFTTVDGVTTATVPNSAAPDYTFDTLADAQAIQSVVNTPVAEIINNDTYAAEVQALNALAGRGSNDFGDTAIEAWRASKAAPLTAAGITNVFGTTDFEIPVVSQARAQEIIAAGRIASGPNTGRYYFSTAQAAELTSLGVRRNSFNVAGGATTIIGNTPIVGGTIISSVEGFDSFTAATVSPALDAYNSERSSTLTSLFAGGDQPFNYGVISGAVTLVADEIKAVVEDAYDAGYESGYEDGYADGYRDGFSDGFTAGRDS